MSGRAVYWLGWGRKGEEKGKDTDVVTYIVILRTAAVYNVVLDIAARRHDVCSEGKVRQKKQSYVLL